MLIAASSSLADLGELIQADRVHGRLYRDPDLFKREMEEIFQKVWVYLAHDSEVAKNGDYVRRQIGLQPVIVIRGNDGIVRVLFNRCRHRGNLVCNHDQGHVATLRCPYHGWTYSTQGDLVAPTFDEAYDSSLRKEDFGLTPAPRMQIYRGLIFASASPDGVSLDEHLGSAKEFLDLIIDRSPEGQIELSAGVQKMRYLANWKMLPENSVEGGYHGHFIHKFAFDLFDRLSGRDRMVPEEQWVRYLKGGHMVQDFRSVQFRTPQKQTAAQKAYVEMLTKSYGHDRVQSLLFDRAPILFVFPNLLYVQTHIRRMLPVTVNETCVYYQPVMLKGAPPRSIRRFCASTRPVSARPDSCHRTISKSWSAIRSVFRRRAMNGFSSGAAFIVRRSWSMAGVWAMTWMKTSSAGSGNTMPVS